MFRRRLVGFTALLSAGVLLTLYAGVATAQVLAPKVETPLIPPNVDAFNLSFEDFKKYSTMKGFELVGQSYFKVPERTPWAKAQGRPGPETGSGFNTVREYDGIAYLAGYNNPQTLFGIIIADVHDPRNMKELSFIPCNPGTRCNYLRVNREKKILIFNHDNDLRNNPTKPAAGEKPKSGVSFYDVSNPSKPKELAFVPFTPGGSGHGLDADDKYAYSCGQFSADLNREALVIVDYSDPKNIRQISTWHVPGMLKGEQFGPLNQKGPDASSRLFNVTRSSITTIACTWHGAMPAWLFSTSRTGPSPRFSQRMTTFRRSMAAVWERLILHCRW